MLPRKLPELCGLQSLRRLPSVSNGGAPHETDLHRKNSTWTARNKLHNLNAPQARQPGKKIATRVSRLINLGESIRSYVDQSPSNINGVYEMIFKQRLFDVLLGLLFATVLTDQASALYDPGVGLFCSRDPIGYEGSKWNVYQYVQARSLSRVDPKGLSHCTPKPYTDPPSRSISTTTCNVAVRCGPAFWGLGQHCGLIVETDSGTYAIDGTGGCENNFNWTQTIDEYGQTGPFTSFPPSVCECLRISSKQWNDMEVPRDSFGNNSNTSLGCLTRKCGISIDFGSDGPPMGFGRKCGMQWGVQLQCPKSPSPPPPCLREGDCCDKIW